MSIIVLLVHNAFFLFHACTVVIAILLSKYQCCNIHNIDLMKKIDGKSETPVKYYNRYFRCSGLHFFAAAVGEKD